MHLNVKSNSWYLETIFKLEKGQAYSSKQMHGVLLQRKTENPMPGKKDTIIGVRKCISGWMTEPKCGWSCSNDEEIGTCLAKHVRGLKFSQSWFAKNLLWTSFCINVIEKIIIRDQIQWREYNIVINLIHKKKREVRRFKFYHIHKKKRTIQEWTEFNKRTD